MRLLLLLLVTATAAVAQPVAERAPCTYADCAIRIEPGFWSTRIVSGPVGEEAVLGRTGVFGSDLEAIVAENPVAAEHARRRTTRRVQGFALAASGFALYLVGTGLQIDGREGEALAAQVGALGLFLGSALLTLDSERAEARAVWEYNRSLAE